MQNMVGSRPVYVEKKTKYICFSNDCLMLFLLCFVFLKFSPLLPLTFAPPRSLNPSKIIFMTIKYIQNIYCMAIYQENMSSGDELLLNFCEPEIEGNQKFITRSIQLVNSYLFHISTLSVFSISYTQQRSIFLPYTASPGTPFQQRKSSFIGNIIKVKNIMFRF